MRSPKAGKSPKPITKKKTKRSRNPKKAKIIPQPPEDGCWKGYQRVRGTKRFAKNSCRKIVPKKPQTAFFLYLGDRRDDYKKENPKKSLGELTKGLSEEWKNLSPKNKAKFEKKAAEDKARYTKAMK
jgi:hypothetical protein